MKNVLEFAARQTERIAESLAHFVATTPADKLVWHPVVEGSAPTRSIMEQVGECVTVNRYMAAVMRGEQVKAPTGDWPAVHFASGQEAQEKLISSARELAQAIRGMDPESLSQPFQLRRGPTLGENLILMPYRNMAYHAGQANLIQTLAGDAEFHVPVTWY